MAHSKWCGNPCSNCITPCSTDLSIPCNPDCEGIDSKTDNYNISKCTLCDAYIDSYSDKGLF